MTDPTPNVGGRPLTRPEEGPRTHRVDVRLSDVQNEHLDRIVEREGLKTRGGAVDWLILTDRLRQPLPGS